MRLMQRAGAAVLCFLPCAIFAQAPEPKPDSPAVRALIDRAKAVAALGLDPAQVKAIVVGHGHVDHFGGSAYLQERYGTKIYISAADWTLMENPPPARGGRPGGTVLTPGIISDEGLRTYRASVAHFKEATQAARVDVEMQNHPLMDPIQPKLDRLKARTAGQPHPFVVGEAGYQAFLDVMALCTDVNIARRQP